MALHRMSLAYVVMQVSMMGGHLDVLASASAAPGSATLSQAAPAAVAAAPAAVAAAPASLPLDPRTQVNDHVVYAMNLVGPLSEGLAIAVVQVLGSRVGAAAAMPYRAFLKQACMTANVGLCRAVLAVMLPDLPWPWAAQALDG